MKDVTSSDIKIALSKKHGDREFFITECKNGPTGVRTGQLLQFDAVAIYKSWSHPQIRGYEIKISRSDFLRDIKYSKYLPYFHEFYFVVPNGMVQRQEVEENIGLMWYNPQTSTITTKRKAVWRNIEIDPQMLLYIIMNRLESDRLPFYSTKTEYWNDWLNNKLSNRELGWKVRCKLIREIEELERENQKYESLKGVHKEYEELLQVIHKKGISTWRNVPKALDEALSRSYPMELDTVLNQLQAAIREIDKLKSKEVDL